MSYKTRLLMCRLQNSCIRICTATIPSLRSTDQLAHPCTMILVDRTACTVTVFLSNRMVCYINDHHFFPINRKQRNQETACSLDSGNKNAAVSVMLRVRPARDFSLVAADVALHHLLHPPIHPSQAMRPCMKPTRPVDGARRHERP